MSGRRLLCSKYFLCIRRTFLQCKTHRQFCTIHDLPLKGFSNEILNDIRKSENIWRRKNKYQLTNHLHQCFVQSDQLLNYITDMIICINNRKSCSSDLTFFIVKNLGDYVHENKIEFYPSLTQKAEILLSIVNQPNPDYQLIQLVCNVFKINEVAHSFKELIENLVWQHKLTEAAYCVSALHLQKEFEIQKILLPLLLEGKIHPAVIYMTHQPDLQVMAVKLLDGYLDRKDSTVVSCENPRRVIKTLTSIINLHKIPLVHCPNLHMIRSKGAINALINKHMQQFMSETTYEDMLMSVIGENDYLKRFLIKKLILKKDIKTAKKMAERYSIKDTDLCLSIPSEDNLENGDDLIGKTEDLEISCDDQSKSNGNGCVDHLHFSLKPEDIKIIANQTDFMHCIKDISEKYNMIGIDAEWKPHFGLSRDRLALIQLAVHDQVFIFDVLLLLECLEAEHWDKLFDDIFGNPNIIKLGCNIMTDVNMILECIKGSKGKTIKFSHILDMAIFYQKLQEVYPEILGEGDKSCTKGLSFLCDIILGKPLNKEERLCDWEKRPLKESQLVYAALDAHCLLEMYDKLREDSIKKNINFDHLSTVAIISTTSQLKPKRRFKAVKSEKSLQINSSIPIQQFKVVMDSVFESQGKELRRLGADVFIMESGDSADIAIELSKTEGRIIICSQELWNQVKNRVKEGFCYLFPTITEDPTRVTNFLQYFNAQLTPESVFTRCIVCNNNDGLKLLPEDFTLLQRLLKTNMSLNSVVKDNLTCFSSELQTVLKNIQSSNINLKFTSFDHSTSDHGCAFLCKKCGSIS